jgi:hypothetical protein
VTADPAVLGFAGFDFAIFSRFAVVVAKLVRHEKGL